MKKILLVIGDAAELFDTFHPLYRIREDGDKLWLREIQPAPKQPVEPKKGTTK